MSKDFNFVVIYTNIRLTDTDKFYDQTDNECNV